MVVFVVVFVVLAFFVVVFVVVFFVLAFFVLFFVFRHGEVVGASLTVEFFAVFGVLSQVVNIRCARPVQIATQFIDKQRLKVECFHASRHGVRCRRKGCICAHGVEGFVDPRLETEPVVEEHIRRLQANQVLSRWLVVVDRNVTCTHHLDVNQISANSGHDLFNVIG